MLFFIYYLAFVILFGIFIYLPCRYIKLPSMNIAIIAIALVLFVFLLFNELENFPTGSFFNGRAP
ncbi:hypothetical protein SD71_07315 [Cohnella kolymensis]|uniref:Uncharacterized protein n=1 Tax=Cohnella kolymensis TaxID=1590652 RepID=A0ABR5A813_9BACL|nr:hypothetical protein SD71_07315 [Cohnella kolymensis]